MSVMSAKISTLATIAVFLVLAACTTATPTIPAPIQGPFLTEAEAIGIAQTHGDSLRVNCGPDKGSTARYVDGKWIVTLTYCTFIVEDQTGVVISR